MKIQYKFLIIFVVAFVITIVPNLFLFHSDVITWLPIYIWTYLSIVRFLVLIGLFVIVTHYWIIKPLNRIARSLSLNDPLHVAVLSDRSDEIGEIGRLLQRFFSQRTELDKIMKEKSDALESLAVSEAKSRALLMAIPDVLLRVNMAGIITDYHAPDPAELSVPPEEFLDKRIEHLWPAHVTDSYYQAVLGIAGSSKGQTFEYSLHLPDGSERAYEALVSSAGTGDYLISVRNITIRKEAELEIKRMLSKQKELNRMKSRFISLVSHEFRTPLSAISSNIQLLSRYREKWSSEKNAEVIRRIQQTINKMIVLLEEVTLIAKDQSGILSVNYETIHLNEFVHEVIGELRKSEELPIHLELRIAAGEDEIASDKELLRQILSHLISNAGKFDPGHKPVRISVAGENSHIKIKITDHGIGIPENDLDHLFQPFHRGSNTDEIPGTGLGMSIVKRCIDLLKGSIRVVSTVDHGTTFEIKIPQKVAMTTDYEQNPDY